MQTKNYLLLLCLFCLCIGCSRSQQGTPASFDENVVIVRDTIVREVVRTVVRDRETAPPVFVAIANISFPADDTILVTSTRISRGPTWDDGQENFFFYQLLLSNIGEINRIHVEKIGWLDIGDQLYLANRVEVHSEVFGQKWGLWFPEVIKWISPTIVRILTNNREYDLDIPAMTATAVSL